MSEHTPFRKLTANWSSERLARVMKVRQEMERLLAAENAKNAAKHQESKNRGDT